MQRLMVFCLLVALVGCGDETKKEKNSSKGDANNASATKPAAPSRPVAENGNPPKEPDEKEAVVPEASITSVMGEFETAMQDFMKKYRTAKSDEERSAMVQTDLPKANPYAERLLSLVAIDPSSEDAVKALTFISQRAEGEITDKATALLLEHHIDSDKMAEIAFGKMRGAPTQKSQDFLQALTEQSTSERVKGVAAYARVMQYQNGQRTWDYYKTELDKDEPEESAEQVKLQEAFDQFAESLTENARLFFETGKMADGKDVESLIEEVNKQYADVVLMERADTKTLIGEKCESTLFELRNLVVGKTAPDIEGEDLDGEEFQLSDYRGKVVVIDFWGDW